MSYTTLMDGQSSPPKKEKMMINLKDYPERLLEAARKAETAEQWAEVARLEQDWIDNRPIEGLSDEVLKSPEFQAVVLMARLANSFMYNSKSYDVRQSAARNSVILEQVLCGKPLEREAR